MTPAAQRFRHFRRSVDGAAAPRLLARLTRVATVAIAAFAVGCDPAAGYCAASSDVTPDRWIQCDKSCTKGNQASCARQIELGKQLCHDKLSVYHCMRACSAGDALACARAKAATR